MKIRPRLLPLLILATTALLGLKVSDLVTNGSGVVANVAHAQAASHSSSNASGTPVDLTNQANDPASKQAPGRGTQTASAPSDGAPSSPPRAPAKDPLLLSPSEISILQQLSERRATLDQQTAELAQREALLKATEKRLDDKIAKLADMQKAIAAADQKHNQEEDARTQSLVKIYETMKPKDAAQILEQLDMPVALTLIGHMKESKTAPVLSAMTPAKAKAITTALAAMHSQPDAPKP